MSYITLIGRVGNDPKILENVTFVSVAESIKVKEEFKTVWYSVACTGYSCQEANRLQKGDKIVIIGNLDVPEVYNESVRQKVFAQKVIKCDSHKKDETLDQHSVEKGNAFVPDDDIPF